MLGQDRGFGESTWQSGGYDEDVDSIGGTSEPGRAARGGKAKREDGQRLGYVRRQSRRTGKSGSCR